MKIIPSRTMRLGGEHLARGVAVNVCAEDAAKAIRHGWAVAVPAAAPRAEKKTPPATDAAPAATEASD